jgi:hemolysin activation/secretion protein
METAVYPYLGPYRTKGDVEGAREALLEAYREKGYQTVDVQIPQQKLAHGVVYLKVVASTVGRIRVNGSRFYDLDQIRSEVPTLQPGTVPNFSNLPKDLLGLNALPDRQITPALKIGTTPGTVDFDLNVKDHFPLHGNVEFNNRASANTSPYHATATVSYDNLFQLGHSLSLSYSVTPYNVSQSKVYSVSYLARIPNQPNLSFLVYGLKSESNVATVGSIDVAGQGDVLGLRGIFTLPSEKGFSQSLSLGVDYKSFQQDINLGGSQISSPITYYPLSATYTGNWQHGDGSNTVLSAGPTFNVRELGSQSQAFDADRFGANGDFFYIHADLAHTQELPFGFQLYNHAQGQVADQPLVNSEQISGGGLDTVRGYLESEVLGDNGAIGNFELRSPSFSRWLGTDVNEWRIYEFCDAGIFALDSPQSGQISQYDLASLGVGTKGEFFNHLYSSADLAFPLLAGANTDHDIWRVTFRVWAMF